METPDIEAALFNKFSEENEGNDDVHGWIMSADDYYDFLESCSIGHRKVRHLVNERKAGFSVRLTRKGAALCRIKLAAADQSSPPQRTGGGLVGA